MKPEKLSVFIRASGENSDSLISNQTIHLAIIGHIKGLVLVYILPEELTKPPTEAQHYNE